MTEKRLVDIGEGRIVEMTELGEAPPSSAPVRKAPKQSKGSRAGKRKKSASAWNTKETGKHQGRNPGPRKKIQTVPGFADWFLMRKQQDNQYLIANKSKSRFGIPDGMRKEEAMAAWAEARRKAQIHMANLKKVGLLPEDELIVKATQATLEVMESPLNQDMKLKAARQLLDFYKPKPVSKSEVTVNAAEAWLASIAEEATKAE